MIWREDAAIWEIIAGELVAQRGNPIAGDPATLRERGRAGAADALARLRENDKDAAGHALIGAALALGLTAWTETAEETPLESFAGELAAAASYSSAEPTEEELAELVSELADGGGETLWELAVQAGSYAAGLSPFITRRRRRRDLVEVTEG